MLTMSWDDGHPADLRVAEMMARHGIKGTFYVPIQNKEGLRVMSLANLRQLAANHEIGSHTYTHCYLTALSAGEAKREISTGKDALEAMIGRSVAGFCYPGGRVTDDHVACVREAGFRYARGIENCRTDLVFESFRMPTTLQIYPHKRSIYLQNFVTQGHWRRRALLLPALLRRNELLGRLVGCFESARLRAGNSVVHFWGHSWELDTFGGWTTLEHLLRYLADQPDTLMVDNQEVATRATRGLRPLDAYSG